MTTNKPEVLGYLIRVSGQNILVDHTNNPDGLEKLISLSDYEAIQVEFGALAEALAACRDELMWMIERHNQQDQNDGSWLYDYQTVVEADTVLATHHKGGDQL